MPKLPELDGPARKRVALSSPEAAASVARVLGHRSKGKDIAVWGVVSREFVMSHPEVKKQLLDWYEKQ